MTQACRITGRLTGEMVLPDARWPNLLVRNRVDPAHVRVKRLGGDLNNAISLAHHLHQEWHQVGRDSWCEKHGQTWEGLLEMARQQTEQFLSEHPELAARYTKENGE